ncbi:MAG: type I-U CRISPR-associated protein Csx17 [Nannocystaceae bacterium]
MTHSIVLQGCQPEPVASYLKALGVFRVVAEQCDARVCAHWSKDGFVLTTELDAEELVRMLLNEYRPSPIVTPWNGGSGFFFGKGGKVTPLNQALLKIEGSSASRFGPLRAAILTARAILDDEKLTEKPDPKREKPALIARMRDEMDDSVVQWIDACVLIHDDKVSPAPFLGSGGNDGRLDFANNFHGRLTDLIDAETGAGKMEGGLRGALFGSPTRDTASDAIGFFDPKALGGANSTEGFGISSIVNPWHYVLMLEGTLCFAAASTRRLEAKGPGGLSFPFTVHNSGAGYSSASPMDVAEGRKELWLPLWEKAATFTEIENLFREGRTRLGRKTVRNGLEFARAVGSLAGARGVTSFTRHGFHVRNGLSYLASPIGRWEVKPNPSLALVDAHLDRWISRYHQKSGKTASAEQTRRGLDQAMFNFARASKPENAQALLGELANAESHVARAGLKKEISPLPWLSRRWLPVCDDGSAEFRLAKHLTQAGVPPIQGKKGLAGHPLRERLVPTQQGAFLRWAEHPREVTFAARTPLVNLLATLKRDDLTQVVRRGSGTPLSDITTFIEGGLFDDFKFGRLLAALALITPDKSPTSRASPTKGSAHLPYAYKIAAVAFQRWQGRDEPLLHPTTGLVSAGSSGDALRFTALALERLRSAGWRLSVAAHHLSPVTTQRICAALLFPVSDSQLNKFKRTLNLGDTHHEPA